MQMTGLHGTSSMKPELTQHHGQMACRTTLHSHTSPSLYVSPALSVPSLSFNLNLHLSLCLTHSMLLCLCLCFIFSPSPSLYPLLLSLLTYFPLLQGLRGASVERCANTICTEMTTASIKIDQMHPRFKLGNAK